MSAQCAKVFSGTVITNDCITNAAALPGGNLGQVYSQTLLAPALTAPMTWVLLNGTIPDGLTLNTSTGVISGTPTLESNYSFQIQVTDVNGLDCLKNFTLSIGAAAPSCGWWSDFPLAADETQVGPDAVATITPSGSLTGVVNFTMNLDVNENALYAPTVAVSGTKIYTGPIVALKFLVNVPIFQSPEVGSFVELVFDGVSIGTITAAGSYEYTATVPSSVADSFQFTVSISRAEQASAGIIECNVRLACASITLSGEVGYFYDPTTNPLGQYQTTPGTPNPTATFTLVSPNPISVQMRARCVHTEGMTGESGTVDGVPIVWQDNNPPDQLMVTDPNPMQFDLDACVPKVIQINLTGNPGFNNTGQLYFVPV